MPSPVGRNVPTGSLPFTIAGDIHAGQQLSSSVQGNCQTGSHSGSKCQADQLKQADKGRTILDLENIQSYLPETAALGPPGGGDAEELGLVTAGVLSCFPEALRGQSHSRASRAARAPGRGQGGWSMTKPVSTRLCDPLAQWLTRAGWGPALPHTDSRSSPSAPTQPRPRQRRPGQMPLPGWPSNRHFSQFCRLGMHDQGGSMVASGWGPSAWLVDGAFLHVLTF